MTVSKEERLAMVSRWSTLLLAGTIGISLGVGLALGLVVHDQKHRSNEVREELKRITKEFEETRREVEDVAILTKLFIRFSNDKLIRPTPRVSVIRGHCAILEGVVPNGRIREQAAFLAVEHNGVDCVENRLQISSQ